MQELLRGVIVSRVEIIHSVGVGAAAPCARIQIPLRPHSAGFPCSCQAVIVPAAVKFGAVRDSCCWKERRQKRKRLVAAAAHFECFLFWKDTFNNYSSLDNCFHPFITSLQSTLITAISFSPFSILITFQWQAITTLFFLRRRPRIILFALLQHSWAGVVVTIQDMEGASQSVSQSLQCQSKWR